MTETLLKHTSMLECVFCQFLLGLLVINNGGSLNERHNNGKEKIDFMNGSFPPKTAVPCLKMAVRLWNIHSDRSLTIASLKVCTTPPGFTLNSTVFVRSGEVSAGTSAKVNTKTSTAATLAERAIRGRSIASCSVVVAVFQAVTGAPGYLVSGRRLVTSHLCAVK